MVPNIYFNDIQNFLTYDEYIGDSKVGLGHHDYDIMLCVQVKF